MKFQLQAQFVKWPHHAHRPKTTLAVFTHDLLPLGHICLAVLDIQLIAPSTSACPDSDPVVPPWHAALEDNLIAVQR